MRFGRPELLWLLLIVPALGVWLAIALARRRAALARFAGESLAGRLVQAAPLPRLVVKSALLILAAAFVLLAAARPQWGSTMQQVTRQGVDIMLAIDISESMLAEDLKPSRLLKSVREASSLLDRLDGDRVGLVAFAGSAGVLCPLTVDYNAVRIFLASMTPDVISYPGSALEEAIKAGMRGFSKEQKKFKVMIIFSDGEDTVNPEAVEAAAKEAAAQGVVIHAVGVGTPAGEPIPIRGRGEEIIGYKKDKEGRVVTTRLDETMLERVSDATGGSYFPATAAEQEVERLAELISGMDKKELQARLMTQYEERYQTPLTIGLILLAAEALLSGRRRLREAASGDALPSGAPVSGGKEAA